MAFGVRTVGLPGPFLCSTLRVSRDTNGISQNIQTISLQERKIWKFFTETRLSVIIMIVLKVQNRNKYFCFKGVKEAILARGGIISTRPEGPMDYKTPNGQNRLLFQNTQVHT
jgi:hypothetical protein